MSKKLTSRNNYKKPNDRPKTGGRSGFRSIGIDLCRAPGIVVF